MYCAHVYLAYHNSKHLVYDMSSILHLKTNKLTPNSTSIVYHKHDDTNLVMNTLQKLNSDTRSNLKTNINIYLVINTMTRLTEISICYPKMAR